MTLAHPELIGHQRPRIWHAPPSVGSLGREIADLSSLAGLYLDDWQVWCLEQAMVTAEDVVFNEILGEYQHKWAAFEVGLVVSRQNGKGPHALDTPIYTDRGWTTFADIEPGCSVYGSDGRPVKVLAVSEVFRNEDCYRVTFTDGSSYVVGGGHLWPVARKGTDWQDRTTEYLASRVGGRRADNGRMEFNWRVRCDAVLDTERADLPIDPYLLGYWLGDGTTGNACLTVGHEDLAWVADRLAGLGVVVGLPVLKDHGNAWNLPFYIGPKWSSDGFRPRMRAMGCLTEKRIPDAYLTASIEQRKALLAGLMDSDGSISTTNRAPQVEFATSFPGLAEDFLRLARSLGIRVARKDGATQLDGVRKQDRARFLWTPAFNPFVMPRKASRWSAPVSKRHELMSITSITRVPTVPVRCIQVDAEDGVYLVGRTFTPTHNSLLEARELAGLFLLGERLIIHSAHQFDTSKEAFSRILMLIENTPDLDREVFRVVRSHGEEGIELKTGQRLRFRTRTKGGGRGFTADCLILDEAMYLGAVQVGALMPTLSARPNPQIWYTGSAGDKDSTQLGRVRSRALRFDDPRLFFAEWSINAHTDFCPSDCDEHDEPDTVESYAKANPGLGIRISIEHVESERRSMDEKTFLQERLGVGDWPVEGDEWHIIGKDSWEGRINEASCIVDDRTLVLAVDTTPDRGYSAIAAAGLNDDKLTHVEVTSDELKFDHRPGTSWVVPRVLAMWNAVKPACVVIDKTSQAGSFIPELEAAGVEVVWPTAAEYALACGEFYSAVVPRKGNEPSLAHLDQVPLTNAVAGAEKRDLADRWAWSKRTSAVDVSPLVAATLAMWGHRKVLIEKPDQQFFASWR